MSATTYPTPKGRSGEPLHERVTRRLREEIVKGWRAPGTPLGEEELASDFGISRNPIREAIRRLEAEGFVTSRPGRGAIVARLGEDEARGVLELRGAVETLMASLAAQHRSPAQVEHLRVLLDEARECLANGDYARLTELNTDFHDTIAMASGNKVAYTVVSQLMQKVEWMYEPAVGGRGPASWAEHEELFAAIEAQDTEHAEQLMKHHIHKATNDYRLRHARKPLEEERP